jgi:hypothetical protein
MGRSGCGPFAMDLRAPNPKAVTDEWSSDGMVAD